MIYLIHYIVFLLHKILEVILSVLQFEDILELYLHLLLVFQI